MLEAAYLCSCPAMAASSELFPQPTFPTMPTSIPCEEATEVSGLPPEALG